MNDETRLEAMLKRDCLLALSGLAGVSALAWMYLLYQTPGMPNMDMRMEPAMLQTRIWDGPDMAVTFAMWAVMMIAMMIPSAAPAVLLFATINRKRREPQGPFVPTVVFLAGHLAAWMGFSALAALTQWGLHSASLSPSVVSVSAILGGVLLVAAGVFQWTPLKHACLAHCRSPQGFFLTEWREGTLGAFLMGLKHGRHCVGCCWMLMSLLLLAGVMNLLWMAAITAFILLEKVAPAGQWVSRAAGLLLAGWGTWLAVSALL